MSATTPLNQKEIVAKVAGLANIPITNTELDKLTAAFAETLEVVDKLQAVDTTNVKPTHQVTDLVNVWREDKIDLNQQFTQNQALANAKHHNGYFVVPRILKSED